MIRCKNLKCNLDKFLLDVDMEIQSGEYFVILGPNGAGKTILLETIAGFTNPSEGTVLIDDLDIMNYPPHKRNIGIVYQDDTLFPHLSVEDNVTYGLRVQKVEKIKIREKLEWISSITNIENLLSRKPLNLSGGEKRRVTIARALILQPQVLLLDEPLSAFDPETRDRMILELKQIHRNINCTTVHVCHDFTEAVSLGDRITLIDNGSIRQIGTPQEIFRLQEE